MSRRVEGGFTLTELLLGLVLLGLVGALAAAVVRTGAMAARQTLGLTGAERTTLTLTALLHEELRDAGGGEISPGAGASVTFRRPIGEGLTCGATGVTLWLERDSWIGTRTPDPGRDAADILTTITPAVWSTRSIVAVAGDHCPLTGSPAWRITLSAADSGVVVRVMEPVRLMAYQTGNDEWIGLATPFSSAPVQPFAGPLVPGTTRFAVDAGRVEVIAQARGDSAVVRRIPLAAP